MKFLIIGDFHGKCNIPLAKIIKKENVDLILSPGDYSGDKMASKLFFKYLYGNDEKDVSLEIRKKIERYEKKGIRRGFGVVKKIRCLEVPFLGVRGNWDPLNYAYDIGSDVGKKDRKDAQKLINLQRDYFRFIDFNLVEARDFIVIGGASSTHPARIDKKSLKKIESEKNVKKIVKGYNKRKKIYENMFLFAKNKKKPVIFLTHNCPYNTKLDGVKYGPAKGKHYGSFLEKEIIRRFKPELVICGHIHENQGKDKIGKSLIVNAGAVIEKKYAVIDFDEIKGKVLKVRFF